MGDGKDRRAELARFLRSRRERITPQQMGLPVSPRRRGRGLRREEVATLAGVSSTWYSYLEQGRDIQPSPGVLDSVGRVLQLGEDELRYIHTLAGHPPGSLALGTGLLGDDLVKLLVKTAGQGPLPVYGANLYCDLIAWNPAAAEWYDDWGGQPPEERNMMRWMFTSPVARARIVNWEDDARDILARWRAMTPDGLADKRLQELVRELCEQSPEFARFWQEHEVQEHRSRIREFSHPTAGRREARLLVTVAPEFAPSFVVFHLPVLPVCRPVADRPGARGAAGRRRCWCVRRKPAVTIPVTRISLAFGCCPARSRESLINRRPADGGPEIRRARACHGVS